MIATLIQIHVKPVAIEKFIKATIQNHRESIMEPGNLRFDFLRLPEDNTRFVLYEAYESEESAAFHKNTAHYLKWRDEVQDYMAEPRQGVKYNIIEPKEKLKW